MKNLGSKVQLILEPISKKIMVYPGTTVYNAIKDLSLGGVCGGKGWCGKCLIQIVKNEANVSPPTEIELKQIEPNELEKGIRLACQTQVLGPSRVLLSEHFFQNSMQILTTGLSVDVPLRPKFWKLVVHVDKAVQDLYVQSDLDRLRYAIKQEISILNVYERPIKTSFNCLQKIPTVLRQEDGHVTATLETNIGEAKDEILLLNVEAGDTTNDHYGIAIDLGTTTIVGYLVNLKTGASLAVESMLNPQTAIGEDIITRMSYVVEEKDGMRKAQQLIFDAFTTLINTLCQSINTTSDKIAELCVVGNTAMHHIFFGLPVDYLGRSPFPPVIKEGIAIRNYHMNILPLDQNSDIYSPPVIGGYVGGDVVADLIACRIDKAIPNTLLIDIGTNGEMVLGNEKRGLWSASCAAGSAFEGAHLKYGMRAAVGAIEKIIINPKTWQPTIDVIGNNVPTGLCGSGIVDIVAEMLRAKIITRSGNFNKNHPDFDKNPRIRKTGDEYEYIIHSEQLPAKYNFKFTEKPKPSQEVVITQNDIREIQKAKGAFLAGARLLIQVQQTKKTELEQILIAGAFGSYIHKENAHFIGLIPDIDLKDVHQIGNAAGIGAQALLKNTDLREIAETFSNTVKYVEIAGLPEFQREYANSMIFPYRDLAEFPSLIKEYEEIPLR